jgi:hypothetical protein
MNQDREDARRYVFALVIGVDLSLKDTHTIMGEQYAGVLTAEEINAEWRHAWFRNIDRQIRVFNKENT